MCTILSTAFKINKWFVMDKSNAIKNEKTLKEYDVFKDSLWRYTGYANEVGESFRVLVPVSWVRFSYVVASTYVACDAVHKGHKAWTKQAPENQPVKTSGTRCKATGIAFMDTLIWQGFASVAIPGFTINRICWLARLSLQRFSRLPQTMRYWGVVAVGLGSIPFIVKPIDRGVDAVMDKTVRTLY